MKTLRVAESAGFCFGVQRSVELAEKLLDEYGACASLGELIHNEDVVRSLEAKGMRVIAEPEECGACEDRCPQHLPIREHLKAVAEHFENK